MYEQLLEEKHQQVYLLSFEQDTLKFDKGRLESQLEEAHQELKVLKLEHTVTTATTTPMHTTVAENLTCGRRRLPQLPVTAPVHNLELESHQGELTSGVRTEDDLLPRVSAVTSGNSEVSRGPLFGPTSQPLFTDASALMHFSAASLHPTSVSAMFPVVTTCAGSAPTTVAPLLLSATAGSFVSTIPAVVSADSSPSTEAKQPPGFKELRDRVAKFSGESSKAFDVWLADYCEAMTDVGGLMT